jgi:hypothetical protein
MLKRSPKSMTLSDGQYAMDLSNFLFRHETRLKYTSSLYF